MWAYAASSTVANLAKLKCCNYNGSFWGRVERYSHGGYLIKVATVGLSRKGHSRALPYLEWSNINYAP
jgi:hypothetical protein